MKFMAGMAAGVAVMWALEWRETRRALRIYDAHRQAWRSAWGGAR